MVRTLGMRRDKKKGKKKRQARTGLVRMPIYVSKELKRIMKKISDATGESISRLVSPVLEAHFCTSYIVSSHK